MTPERRRTYLPPGFALVLWAVVTALGCDGCEPRADLDPESLAPKPEFDQPRPESLLLSHRLIKLAGEPDFSNRYLGTVKVTAMEGEEERMHCGGAVIGPRVVLTAAHCVCRQHPEADGQTVITASDCYTRAEIETLLYLPTPEEEAPLRPSQGTMHEGRVQPHPQFKAVLDSTGHVSSSHADLALIFLETPVKFDGFLLAREAPRMGETVIIAGHGYDEVERGFGWERRFCPNQVSRLGTPEDERVLIQQPGGHRYRQDSGGPCLRQGTKTPELLGISNRWLGEGAAFTSIQAHRNWLQEALQRAKAAENSGSNHPR